LEAKKTLTRSEMIARIGMAPIAIGAFAALVAEADAADNKAQFKYQTKPNGKKMCSNCSLFKAPNKCSVVTGVISPKGYCIAYAPKG
jgi:hypothetical protein